MQSTFTFHRYLNKYSIYLFVKHWMAKRRNLFYYGQNFLTSFPPAQIILNRPTAIRI